jgi:hypothetical protein
LKDIAYWGKEQSSPTGAQNKARLQTQPCMAVACFNPCKQSVLRSLLHIESTRENLHKCVCHALREHQLSAHHKTYGHPWNSHVCAHAQDPPVWQLPQAQRFMRNTNTNDHTIRQPANTTATHAQATQPHGTVQATTASLVCAGLLQSRPSRRRALPLVCALAAGCAAP